VLIVLGIVLYLQIGPATLGAEEWYQTSPYLETGFFLLMLIGMAARYVTKAIEVRRERISELKKAGGPFTKPPLEFDIW